MAYKVHLIWIEDLVHEENVEYL